MPQTGAADEDLKAEKKADFVVASLRSLHPESSYSSERNDKTTCLLPTTRCVRARCGDPQLDKTVDVDSRGAMRHCCTSTRSCFVVTAPVVGCLFI